ncbi:dipeptide ABC transporter ATP-binding protein [Micromonospora chokoriensis]|uniref:dipeptide ABC transporter ATP-binding protein n=1 Tax=Micromonospora chokoriensis TaxID=356851 RepID=UPI00068B734E|nr:ABC transporter ATP-binding protein [Micromonospora chokoriensis]
MTVSSTEPHLTKATRSPLLAVAGLAVSFEVDGETHQAVHDASFELHRGQVLALVGESGSGKSVTAMATLGLLPATARVSGSITLAGTELIGAEPRLLREVRGGRIGTIFQEPMTALNPVFTIGDQIAEAIRAHRPVRRAAAAAQVLELLGTVGLDDPSRVARSYPHELSGGQLQRAMISMAISCDPVLLIADEPTTALDVTVQAGILDLLRDLRKRLDMAVLLITHDMGVVADVADTVVVLRDGQIVEQATAAQLFSAPRHEYTRTLLHAVPRLPELRLAEPGTPQPPEPQPLDPTLPPPVVQLRNVVVEYPGRRRGHPVRAVDDVCLHIDQGEMVALVGESGSGKSTIGRALAGLLPTTSGTVTVAGVEVGRATRRELRNFRSQLGIVFQDPASSLNPRRTVGASIAEPLSLHTDLSPDAQRRRVDELLEAVELPSRLHDRHPHEMSGGQRQRVAIARAIALNPALLIADEPTSALDVSVQARILDLLLALQRQIGFSCLFISHDLAVVEQLADRVAVLHRGRVVEEGPVQTVLRAPRHPYTARLLAAAPVADPTRQALRREAWRQLTLASP